MTVLARTRRGARALRRCRVSLGGPLALSLLCAAAQPASPQTPSARAVVPTPGRYAEAIRAARALVRDGMAAGAIPGLSVAVAVNGKVVWSEGFGLADVENHVPVSPDTRFRIGSVSKPLTAAAVALLYEQGKLDLDAPVQRYVPSFPAKKYPITTRQLAGHIAGIRHYRGGEPLNMKHYDTVLDGLAIFRDDTLLFAPGSRFEYSSYGWNLISAVVEGASGEPFPRYMQTHVFDPLQLHSVIAEYPDSIVEHRAHFYVRSERGALLNAPYVDNSYKWAGGGFLANTEDLARFGSALLRPGFLRAETLKLLFTAQRTSAGAETGYGIGWYVDHEGGGERVLHHGGSSVGANAHLAIFPDWGVVVAMAANTNSAFVGGGAGVRQVAQLFRH